jgi:centromeric protein E
MSHEDSAKLLPPRVKRSSRDETPCDRRSISLNMKKMQRMFQSAAKENVSSIRDYVIKLTERAANLQ